MTISPKRIALLGSTGSIGLSSLAVIESLGSDFQLLSASAHSNYKLLAQQARRFKLPRVVLTDPQCSSQLYKELYGSGIKIDIGPEHLVDLVTDPQCDIVIAAVVGAAGLPAVLAAVQSGKTVAIANKESLVVAGSLLMPLADRHNGRILPIDSEHSAILQAMHSGRREEVKKVIITGSGGPFRNATALQMSRATLKEALNHPTWNMGPKITIDSATLMNKALELIEARWLFDLAPEQIEILIHPESIVHSLVEFCDGSVIAQMSPPDMRLPIQYALTYPERRPCPTKWLNLQELGKLTFEKPDPDRFPALRLGYEVARRGGTAGAVLNGANEAAVEAFRQGLINFPQIVQLTEKALTEHKLLQQPDLDQLSQADQWSRAFVKNLISSSNLP